jgi:hypothetical protein
MKGAATNIAKLDEYIGAYYEDNLDQKLKASK